MKLLKLSKKKTQTTKNPKTDKLGAAIIKSAKKF